MPSTVQLLYDRNTGRVKRKRHYNLQINRGRRTNYLRTFRKDSVSGMSTEAYEFAIWMCEMLA